jgi:hypothetical protein
VAFFLGGFHLRDSPTIAVYAAEHTSEYAAQTTMRERLQPQIDRLSQTVNGYYALIPANKGKALVNFEIYDALTSQVTNINMSLVENSNSPNDVYRQYPDDYGRGLIRLNVTEAMFFETNQYEAALARRIEAGEYEMIMVGPEMELAQISYALRNASDEATSRYCAIYLPFFSSLKNIRHYSSILLSNRTQCKQLMVDAADYSSRIFGEVCGIDEWTANHIINEGLSNNKILSEGQSKSKPFDLGIRCESGADILDPYNEGNNPSKTANTLRTLVFAGVCIVLTTAWAASKKQKRKPKRALRGSNPRHLD